jgi:hypothetical protein
MGDFCTEGRYDLLNMQCLPAGVEPEEGPFGPGALPNDSNSERDAPQALLAPPKRLFIPANPITQDFVVRLMSGEIGKAEIVEYQNGAAGIWMTSGFDTSVREFIAIKGPDEPPPTPKETPPPRQVASVAKKRPKADRHDEVPAEKPEILGLLRDDKEPLLDGSPGGLFRLMISMPDPTAREREFVLPAPSAGAPEPEDTSTAVDRIADDVNKKGCTKEACVCTHRPCIPCGLEISKGRGESEELWAASWILWYSIEASPRERELAVQWATPDERRVLKTYKAKWHFADEYDAPLVSFNWNAGRLPGIIDGRVIDARKLKDRGVAAVQRKSLDYGAINEALKIAYDQTADEGARIYALNWVAQYINDDRDIRTAVKRLAMGEANVAVRKRALEILESAQGKVALKPQPEGPDNP